MASTENIHQSILVHKKSISLSSFENYPSFTVALGFSGVRYNAGK